MSELQCVARLNIHDGKLDEFKRPAAQCAALVRTKDTGTLQYELYVNSANTACLVFERYRDSQALLEHHTHLGDTMAAMLQTCSGSGAICGTPSPELLEQIKDAPVQVYTPLLAHEVTREDVVVGCSCAPASQCMQADFPQCRWLLYVGALSLFVAVLLTGGGVLSNLRAPETATEQERQPRPALRSVGPLRPREAL